MNRRRSCSEWASMSELCMLSMTSNVIQQHTVYVRVSVTAIEERIHTLSLRGNLVWSKVAVAVLCLHCWQQWLCLSICAVSVYSVWWWWQLFAEKDLELSICGWDHLSEWSDGMWLEAAPRSTDWQGGGACASWMIGSGGCWLPRLGICWYIPITIYDHHHLCHHHHLYSLQMLSYRRSAVYWVTKRSVKLKETEDVLLLALNDDDLDDDDESRAINHHIS